MRMSTTTTQRRAVAGGEFGANGEWYDGGKFIATQENTIKCAPMVRPEPTAAELAERAARAEQDRITVARLQMWLAARRERFADLITRLTANPGHDPKWWAELLQNNQAGFYPSLGKQLQSGGSLTPRQSEFVAKFVFGRANRKNEQAWDALVADLSEDFT